MHLLCSIELGWIMIIMVVQWAKSWIVVAGSSIETRVEVFCSITNREI